MPRKRQSTIVRGKRVSARGYLRSGGLKPTVVPKSIPMIIAVSPMVVFLPMMRFRYRAVAKDEYFFL